jgi:hypothetical protein
MLHSHLYSDALEDYLMRHSRDEFTEAMKRVFTEIGSTKYKFISSAARRVLQESQW